MIGPNEPTQKLKPLLPGEADRSSAESLSADLDPAIADPASALAALSRAPISPSPPPALDRHQHDRSPTSSPSSSVQIASVSLRFVLDFGRSLAIGGELGVSDCGVGKEASGRGRRSRDAWRGTLRAPGPPWTRIEEIPPWTGPRVGLQTESPRSRESVIPPFSVASLARFLLRRRNEDQQRCCCGYAAGAPRCVSTMYSTLLK